MAITKILNADITIANYEPGYTYRFVVETTDCPTEFQEGQVLCFGAIIAAVSTLTCTIVYEECTHLVIKLEIIFGEDVCDELHFDVINDETSTQKHYKCILNETGDTSACEEFPGTADGTGEYATIEECQACIGCPCSVTVDPCSIYVFSGSFTCPLGDPLAPGTVTVCINGGITPSTPVIMTGFELRNPSGDVIYTSTDEYIFTVNGQCHDITDIILPAGQYVVHGYFNTIECLENEAEFTVNCPLIPCADCNEFISCCETSDAAGNDVGNMGNINCYTLFYPAAMDENEDIVIDFGANGVADKLEVYQGIVNCELIQGFTPIASTPYIGSLANGEYGYCHNIAPNFIPAIGDVSDPENTVVEGFWSGTNVPVFPYLPGPYHPTTNPGSLVGTSITQTSPDWAPSLIGYGNTHYPSGSTYVVNPGQGGNENGRGRLRIKGGTYGNAAKALTLVVHNNGSVFPGYGAGVCGSNTTAWKFYVHCPECPECEGDFNLVATCINTASGRINIGITGDYQAPVDIFITPQLTSWIADIQTQGAPYLYRVSNNTYYALSTVTLPNSTQYLTATIGDDIVAGDTFQFVHVYNGTTYVVGDVPDGGWTVQIKDVMGCDQLLGTTVVCTCAVTPVVAGNTPECVESPVNFTLTLTDGTCTPVFNHTTFTGMPSWLEASNPTGSATQITIKKKPGETQVAGTYLISYVYACPDGCTYEGDFTVVINEFDCNISAIVTPTTCGNNNGAIDLTVTGCTVASYLWNTGDVTQDISGLSPGTYSVTIIDSNGCSNTSQYTITSDSAVVFTVADQLLNCGVANAAEIEILGINGGTAPYTLNIWNSANVLVFGPQAIAGPGPVDYTVVNAALIPPHILEPDIYKVAIVDASGCETAYNVVIDVAITPDLKVNSISETCDYENGAITFFVNTGIYPGTYEYTWALQSTGMDCTTLNLGTTTTNLIVHNLPAETYTICAKEITTDCCVCEDVVIQNTAPEPSIPSLQNKTICIGGSVILTGTCPGGGTLQWFTDALGLVPLNNILVSPVVTTTYYAKCAGPICSSDIVPVTVTVNPLPIADAGVNRTKCASGSCNTSAITLLGNCGACGTCDGSWYLGATLLTTGLSVTVNPSVTTTYTFKCTNTLTGCVGTDTMTVSVNQPPVVTTQNITACAGAAVAFNSVITSPVVPGSLVQWYSGSTCSVLLPSAQSAVHNVAGVYNYSVKVTDPDTGCCKCTAFTLTIAASPTANPTYSYNCATQEITLSVNAGVGCTVVWKEGLTIIGNTAVLTLPYGAGVGQIDNGTYTATVTCGACVSTGIVTVVASPPPTITLPADVSFCTSTGLYPVNVSYTGLTGFTWSATWTGNPATPPIALNCLAGCLSPINVSKANAGILTLTVSGTAANGCTVTDTMVITITTGATLTLNSVCKSPSTTWGNIISGYNPLNTYYWQTSGIPMTCNNSEGTLISSSAQLVPSGATGSVKIKMVTPSGCCVVQSVILKEPLDIDLLYHCSSLGGLAIMDITLLTPTFFGTNYTVNYTVFNVSTSQYFYASTVISSTSPNTISVYDLPSGTYTVTGVPTAVACTSTATIDIECCATCQGTSGWRVQPRYIWAGGFSATAQPATGTAKFHANFNLTNPLESKITTTDRVKYTIYNSLGVSVFSQSNIQMKDILGATLSSNITINGLADGSYAMVIEAADAGTTVYSRVLQTVTVAGGLVSIDVLSMLLGDPSPGAHYDITLPMCDYGVIEMRQDADYTITDMTSGNSQTIEACVSGIEFHTLENISVPTSVIRVQVACHNTTEGNCLSCGTVGGLLSATQNYPAFQDHFFYCS